jgi:hypothetical protein
VIIFTCRDPDSGAENAIGLTHMNIDMRDNSTGAFSMSLYLRQDKGFVTKSVTGSYTTVPNGYIFRTKWRSLQGEFAMIHVHPAEKTSFPGLAGKQSCEVSGQLEAL